MNHCYELIILGSGPAGLAAAIYAARAELDLLVIERAPISGGQIINTNEVDNYPGLPGINGFDLGMKFREHCNTFGVPFIEGEIKSLEEHDGEIIIHLSDTDYHTKTALIATGASPRKLGVAGEEKLTGAGVSYCATCDGAFFRGRTVAVVGGGDVAVEDALFLAKICKKVYVIHRRDAFRAAKSLCTKLLALENVEVLWDHVVDEIVGNSSVSSIKISHVATHEKSEFDVNGVFIAVGNTPASEFCTDLVHSDKNGYLIAGEDGITNISGIFAAGDIRTKDLRQVITAASDGANAITSIEKYLFNQ